METQSAREWDEHYVENELKLSPLRIVMAHNAALETAKQAFAKQVADEREKLAVVSANREADSKNYENYTKENRQLRSQLAAEQEKRKSIVYHTELSERQLSEQLAAERERYGLLLDKVKEGKT